MQNKGFNDTEIDTLEKDSVNDANANDAPTPIVRRKFISQVGSLMAGVTLAALSLKSVRAQGGDFSTMRKLPSGIPTGQDFNARDGNVNLTGAARADRAYEIRVKAAHRERNLPILAHPDNGDEALYHNQNYFANFSKGLRHNEFGEVETQAYHALLAAIGSGQFSDFENLRQFQGCSDALRQRPFVNPLGGNAYDLEGTDSAQLAIEENGTRRPFRPAPAFASAEEASEMVELYWMALLRDVPFDTYDTNSLAQEAAADLSNLSDFRGPKINGQVTTQTLFRDSFPGCTTGPYISQFLLRGTSNNIPGVPHLPAGVSFGAQRFDQRIRNYAAGTDFLTNFTSWLDVQNGCNPALDIPFDNLGLTYIRDGRSIGQYVRLDILYQAYFVAALILINGITLNESTSPFVFRFPFDENNPYGPNGSTIVQGGFGQFGNPHLMTLVTEPSTRALKAVWFQKWRVHRRLRPEEFGGRVEVARQGQRNYPIHSDLTTNSTVLPKILSRFGSYLLPMAFPEGAPLHPAYGSGHATVAGACVTMLKAFFDEDTVIHETFRVDPNNPGQLITYEGPPLTVGGELNKIASNIAQGRNIAGVHWRTDSLEAILLGEQVAISMLRDMAETYGENFSGYSLTKFDGQQITVG
ncbi:MAG: vanadium-dependent haloperoxidase [Acidobacteriota bacterium]|nr:vanadium-dependent haloperoxidase [Acidobacteriota bacterium]